MIELAITKILKLQTDSHVKNAIKYAISDKMDPENGYVIYPTENTFINSVSNVSATKISNSWKRVRQHFRKDEGNLAYQIVQNFGEGISPKLANEIGVRFAKEFLGDRQVIVSTHTNTEYTHNHIIFNSPDIVTGKKFNDCYNSYFNGIRKVSDRLCDEYGLKVLEDTREGTLVFYKDKEGKKRAFEPTKRKSELQHFDSRYAQADVWEKDLRRRKNRVAKIITDMDTVIPMSNDFDDFLQKMRNMGYQIKAKTAQGEWRQHITYFEPDKPDGSRGIRDSNKFLTGYSRTEIEDKIIRYKELAQEQKNEEIQIFSDEQNEISRSDIPNVISEVVYNDVDEISVDVRYDKSKRSEVDKFLAQDIKTMRKEVNNEYYSAFKRNPNIQPRNFKEKMELDTIRRINMKVHTLNFMETHKTYAPNALEDKMKQILTKRDEVAKELDTARSKLNVMNNFVVAIQKAHSLKEHIDNQTAVYGKSYVEIEGQTEIQMYNEIMQKLKSATLDTREQQTDYIRKVEQFKSEYSQLAKNLQIISDSLYRCDDIYRIMKECGYDNTEELKRYEQVRFAHKNRKEQEKSHESEYTER